MSPGGRSCPTGSSSRRSPTASWAGREPAVDGEAALKSLQIIRAIYASAESGRPEKVIYENEEQ